MGRRVKTHPEEMYDEIAFPVGEQNPVASFSKGPLAPLQVPPSQKSVGILVSVGNHKHLTAEAQTTDDPSTRP